MGPSPRTSPQWSFPLDLQSRPAMRSVSSFARARQLSESTSSSTARLQRTRQVAAEGPSEPAGLHGVQAGRARHACERRPPPSDLPGRRGPARRVVPRWPRPGRCGRCPTALRRPRTARRAGGTARAAVREVVREWNEPALALHRLDDDAADSRARPGATRLLERVVRRDAAVRVRAGRTVDLGGERAEAALVVLWVIVIVRRVRPWKAFSKTRTPGFPVAARAILTAFSTASAPEFRSRLFWSSLPQGEARPGGGRRCTAGTDRP